jgi:hemerythrin-like domain-containing protein
LRSESLRERSIISADRRRAKSTPVSSSEWKGARMTTVGQYDTNVSDMFAVHHALTGALDTAPAYVAKAGVDAERVATIGSFFENVVEFLHVHHTGEDELVYPVLEERCPDRRPELVRIDDQHKLLHAPMDQARSAIAAWRATPSDDTAQAVVDAIASIEEQLRPHLAEEEDVMLPIAAKWMSTDEWGRLPGHGMMIFRADKPWLVLGLVREQLDEEQRAAMLAGMPPEMRTMWTEQMEPAFNAFIAEVRR